ncbi:hypothetical protein H6G94_34620 [Nostoc punctiforme FACHB-252]|uniref:Uncharacterized protein n=1 Tax=Nostoc punctiforme FACHB-252 TaxID=1357509 RepID=A0ABR8HLB3_NOSPU|nr:hypothetical protein [Nostoc punctiforme]MBD2616313.1 hypothetical protein [Nostoc punctiforme FACHB-252]
MIKNYNIWELNCNPSSVIPYSQISGARTNPNIEAQKIRQRAVQNIQAERIEIGDIKQTVNNYLGNEDSNFVHLSTDSVCKTIEYFPLSEEIEQELIKKLVENKVLILGGKHDDKIYLAKYLAIKIYHKAKISEDTKIFLIDKIIPSNINNNLTKLLESVEKNFVIATTDIPQASWTLVNNYWWQPITQIYKIESLVNSLWEKLNNETKLILQLVISRSSSNELTDEGIKAIKDYCSKQLQEKGTATFTGVNNCARNLNQLADDIYIKTLIAEEEIIDENKNQIEIIDQKINIIFTLANNQRESLEQWYKNYLSSREQLLAISLSLFHGLFEDQFFAALEKIVEDVWQKRDASLRALDYGDLLNLKNHFEFVDISNETSQLNNFEFVEIQERQIKLIYPDERRILFEVAWDSHRRQILTTLPTIANFIIESAQLNVSNWELSGGAVRRSQLHNVIIETLSEIGLVSKNLTGKVQGALLLLARQKEIAVQNVAARSLERWYQNAGQEDRGQREVFKIIQQFYDLTLIKERYLKDEATKKQKIQPKIEKIPILLKLCLLIINYILTVIQSLLNNLPQLSKGKTQEVSQYSDYIGDNYFIKRIEELESLIFSTLTCLQTSELVLTLTALYRSSTPWWQDEQKINVITEDCVGATVALTVGYIARYDYENSSNLDDFLNSNNFDNFLNWLEELSKSKFPLVHVYLGYHTLFYLVPLYLKQQKFQDWLKKAIQKHLDVLNQAIALSLANAYNVPVNRETIRQLLHEWEQESSPSNNSNQWRNISSKHQALLKTVVFTYGLIEYPENDNFTVKQALNRLINILNSELPLLVRKAVIHAIYNLTFRYFNIIEFQLQSLVNYLTQDEQRKLVEILTNIYLNQRATLSGGNGKIKVNERDYEIWTDSERRLTNLTVIEQAMYRWLRRIDEPEVANNQKQENNQINKTAAQKVALAAFTSFAANFDQEEERRIQELNEEVNNAE